MLQTIDEIKDVEVNAGVVVNGIDNANVMSIDSTESIKSNPEVLEKPTSNVKENTKSDNSDVEQKPTESDIEQKSETVADHTKETETETTLDKPTKQTEQVKTDKTTELTESKSVQKRIGKLTKNWRTAERELESEKAKTIKLQKKLQKMQTQTLSDNKPRKEDFTGEDEYIEALTDWKFDVKFNNLENKKTESAEDNTDANTDTDTDVNTDTTKPSEPIIEQIDGLNDAIENGKLKYDDFEELSLDEDLVLSADLAAIAIDTEYPEDILYYLASNPEESKNLSSISPIKAAKEIGKLEFSLKEEMAQYEEDKKNRQRSNAPDPIKPLVTDSTIEKDPNKMSPKEYKIWRSK